MPAHLTDEQSAQPMSGDSKKKHTNLFYIFGIHAIELFIKLSEIEDEIIRARIKFLASLAVFCLTYGILLSAVGVGMTLSFCPLGIPILIAGSVLTGIACLSAITAILMALHTTKNTRDLASMAGIIIGTGALLGIGFGSGAMAAVPVALLAIFSLASLGIGPKMGPLGPLFAFVGICGLILTFTLFNPAMAGIGLGILLSAIFSGVLGLLASHALLQKLYTQPESPGAAATENNKQNTSDLVENSLFFAVVSEGQENKASERELLIGNI